MRTRSRGAVAVLTLVVSGGCADAADPAGPPLTVRADALTNASANLPGSVFDLATAPDGSLLAGQLFAGVVTELRKGAASPVADVPFVSGIAPVGRGDLLAISGGFAPPPAGRALYRVSRGGSRMIADLGAYEASVNPDGAQIDSNPYNIAGLGGGAALVADAAANALLHVSTSGRVDWVAVLPSGLVDTPAGLPIPGLPPQMVAEPVPTSVAVGPDGDWYVGELRGFPGPTGFSRVWRVAAGSRHQPCPGPACTMVLDGLTSIVDMAFAPDGRLLVLELDAAGWLAVETIGGSGPVAGGTLKACDVDAGTCSVVASGLSVPLALTVDRDGAPWVAEHPVIGGPAHVHPVF